MGVVDSSEFDEELTKLGLAKQAIPIESNIPAKEVNEESFWPSTDDDNETKTIDIPAEIHDIRKGRGIGSNEIPESLRALIGQTALEDGNKAAKVLTEAFGISDSSLSAYKHGSTSTASYSEPSPELKTHVDSTREKITKRATSQLFAALEGITKEKLEATKAKDLAGVAKDMSAIIRNMEPEVDKTPDQQNNYILYAPQFVTEEKFDVIEVND